MLKQLLKNQIEIEKGLANKLITISGLKSKSSLYKFINEKDREFDNIEGLLAIVHHLFPDQEFEIMDRYFREVNPNGKTARISLEYASVNRLNDLKQFMIDKLKESKNAESREWAKVYELDQQAMKGEMSPNEANILFDELVLKTQEMKVLSKVFMIYNYYDMKMVDRCEQVAVLIEDGINDIQKYPFLRKSLKCRIGLINMYIGSREEAIKNGNIVIENAVSELTKAVAFQSLGILFISESYDKAHSYLLKAYEVYLKYNSDNLGATKQTISFLQNYWHKEPDFLDFESENVSDQHEIAFYFIQKKEHEKALDILNKVDLNSQPHFIKGFHYFYHGLISQRREDFFQSVIEFKYANQKMYCHFPLLELKKLGEDELTLKVLEI
ncbi:AimR family lysis-lysogeny pheromone receptor [Alkalihalobacterium chitinilyticum]|uniref:AimR family lysis-lysogeny pheromone receptor n=1 Tax=Alkalihalobacterium chitinilyticum TaxID=2980103 RepID=A0ABT5VN73_9BACI|nr:AimR family lysis-lysogeny pheromone receptor [Alkalihalobacterium chitinilyticum]MDE5415933.1 AimR family lysis-lysogeny pheromone receptor [Alkalihalobacterium chitinilyticum]